MVEVTEETAESLQELADQHELDFDTVRDRFVEKLEVVREKSVDYSQEREESLAYRMTRTNLNKKNRVPTDEVEIATIGGSIREFSNGDSYAGKGLVDLEPNSEDGRKFISTIMFSEDDVNLYEIRDAFGRVGNIIHGEFSVSDADIDGFRILNSQEETDITLHEPDEETRAAIIKEIREHVPEFTIRTISDNLSQRVRDEDSGNLYPASFGVDVKRIEAEIYDGYKNESKGSGAYTVRDDETFDDDDIEATDVYDPDEVNENATPGLTCWTDPYLMEYGSDSIVELYGVVTIGDNGLPSMNVDGIVEIIKDGDFDGYEDDGDSGEQEVESTVDRTSI